MFSSAPGVVDGERAVELRRVDDHVGVGELAELAQLGVGEGGLRGAAATDDDDLAHAACGEHLERVVGGVGGGELGGESTSMRATSSATLPLPITTARSAERRSNSRSVWSGWPLYQPTNSVAACEPGRSSPGMPERPVDGRAGRVDDRVVVREQLLAGDVLAELDVAEEAEARVRGGLLVDAGDGLDLRVVGGDAGAHEPPRRGQALEHVDLEASARRP